VASYWKLRASNLGTENVHPDWSVRGFAECLQDRSRINRDTKRLRQFKSYVIANLTRFLKHQLIEVMTFLKRAPNFYLPEWKHDETDLAEEYWWTITQAARLSCWSRSGSSVLASGFQLDFLVYTHTFDQMCTQSRLAQNSNSPDLPGRNYCVSRGISVPQIRPRPLLSTYLLTYLLTYSMEQSSSWEDNWFCS